MSVTLVPFWVVVALVATVGVLGFLLMVAILLWRPAGLYPVGKR